MMLLLCLLAQDFKVLDSGFHTGKAWEAVYDRITNEAALKSLWERLSPAPGNKEMPKVDFATKMVLAVAPSRDGDRMRLRVESLKEEEGGLTLTCSLTKTLHVDRGPGLILPYVLIEVPRSAAPLCFVEIFKDLAGKVLQERNAKKLEAIK